MNPDVHHYFIVNKPFDMVSQFVSSHKVKLLHGLDYAFPEGTHAIGRLDNFSEGLLILTTNKKVTKLLFESKIPHRRTYLVKVKYKVSQEELEQLRSGVTIRVKGGGYYTTTPCEADIVERPPTLFTSKAETKEYIPYTWLRITLTEGKFHQVRKMVGVLRHQCVRLVRESIEELELGELPAGGVKEVEEGEFFKRLKIGLY
jgi:23S rRNA pseudouridine2457 synthase